MRNLVRSLVVALALFITPAFAGLEIVGPVPSAQAMLVKHIKDYVGTVRELVKSRDTACQDTTCKFDFDRVIFQELLCIDAARRALAVAKEGNDEKFLAAMAVYRSTLEHQRELAAEMLKKYKE